MKKVWAIALLGGLLAFSCSKKEDTESNTMLEEPTVEVMDSTATVKPADNIVVPADSTKMKADSLK